MVHIPLQQGRVMILLEKTVLAEPVSPLFWPSLFRPSLRYDIHGRGRTVGLS